MKFRDIYRVIKFSNIMIYYNDDYFFFPHGSNKSLLRFFNLNVVGVSNDIWFNYSYSLESYHCIRIDLED